MSAVIFVRLALLEAWRGGLAWLAAACIVGALGLGVYIAQLALTESRLLQLAVLAALLRIAAVFIVASQVIASVRREIDERRLELLLSLPLPRARQYVARLAGFAAIGVVVAFLFSLPLALSAPPAAVFAWGLSLACELTLVAAAALFFAMTLQMVPALAATAALYLLARSISAIQAIAKGPLAADSWLQHAARAVIDALAFVLPALDQVSRTEWLLYGAPDARAYGAGLAGVLVYALLLAAAGLFDFHRRGE